MNNGCGKIVENIPIGLRDAVEYPYLLASTSHNCSLDVFIYIVSKVLDNLKNLIDDSSLLP